MKKVRINGKGYDIRLFVFDKDGLMFESRQFWIALAQSRIRAIGKKYPNIEKRVVKKWLALVGVSFTTEEGYLKVMDVDPMGILAVASVPEEIIAAASFFKEHLNIEWIAAKEMAVDIFETGDRLFQLSEALKPRRGFPKIFKRLREAGIPYGIATSDTLLRARASVDMFDDFKWVQFIVTADDVERGKPHTDMLLLIQEKTGIAMNQIAMVGDSLVDVTMARNAGALGVGVPENDVMRMKMQGIADEIIVSLDDIIFEEGR